MLSNEKYKLSDSEVIEKGSRALIKELGYSGFLRYIRKFEGGNGLDYLKVQDSIYKDMNLEEIFEHSSNTWNNDHN